MSDELTQRADRMLEAALERTGAPDPRHTCRDRLRALKDADPDRYAGAVDFYRDELLPGVASGDGDPVVAWIEYGRSLAQALETGRTISIDETGLARPYEGPEPVSLALHLPDRRGAPALLVSAPPNPSPAQQATYHVLVEGKVRAPD